jgi:hypothetical protein
VNCECVRGERAMQARDPRSRGMYLVTGGKDFSWGSGERKQLCLHVQFPDHSVDQLAVLRPGIQHRHRVVDLHAACHPLTNGFRFIEDVKQLSTRHNKVLAYMVHWQHCCINYYWMPPADSVQSHYARGIGTTVVRAEPTPVLPVTEPEPERLTVKLTDLLF